MEYFYNNRCVSKKNAAEQLTVPIRYCIMNGHSKLQLIKRSRLVLAISFGELKMDTEVKQTRIRCSDETFMEAVYSSKTYAEIASKTGQKVASTMARYGRVKKALAQKGITLPEVERKKPVKTVDNVDNLMEIVQRLKAAHSNG